MLSGDTRNLRLLTTFRIYGILKVTNQKGVPLMKRRDIPMKKRYVVLIVIAALRVCTGSFLLITKWRVSVKDGLRQNSRV